MQIKIYSTEACTLCEKVVDQLFGLCLVEGLELIVIDVALDDQLLECYGADIPVIEILEKTLRSPFSDEEMLELIKQFVP